jgi:hypothetical protein
MPELRLVGDAAVAPGKKAKPRGQRRSKAERDAIKNARLTLKADAQVDADLSRAVDAIAFLSRNEIDPAPLIARISPTEAEAVGVNLRKAVEWLNRFADGWHVFIGSIETQGASSGTGFEAGQGGVIRLVHSRD